MPLEMMKNDFYFMLKALLVFKIFKFLSSLFWSCIVKVNFKIHDATDSEKIITTHKLPNI